MNKSKKIISWSLRILLALGFLAASSGKLTNNPQVIEMFSNWGFPANFHFVIGILEFVLAIMLLIPRTLKYALIGLGLLMIGALITHLTCDPILQIIRPLIFMAIICTVYWLNFKDSQIKS